MEKTNFAIQFLLLLCCLRSSSFHFLSAYSLALYFNSRFGYCVRLYIQGFFFCRLFVYLAKGYEDINKIITDV